jgi:hypothetical protein
MNPISSSDFTERRASKTGVASSDFADAAVETKEAVA